MIYPKSSFCWYYHTVPQPAFSLAFFFCVYAWMCCILYCLIIFEDYCCLLNWNNLQIWSSKFCADTRNILKHFCFNKNEDTCLYNPASAQRSHQLHIYLPVVHIKNLSVGIICLLLTPFRNNSIQVNVYSSDSSQMAQVLQREKILIWGCGR